MALFCLCMVQQFELFPTLMLLFPFLFSFFSKHIWRELYCLNSSRYEMIGCGYIFAFSAQPLQSQNTLFWVGMLLRLYTYISHLLYDKCH